MKRTNWIKSNTNVLGLFVVLRSLFLYKIYRRRSNWSHRKKGDVNTDWLSFKKKHTGLLPNYLSSLVPPPVSSVSRYNLRNSNTLRTVQSRTCSTHLFFLQSPVNWTIYLMRLRTHHHWTDSNTILSTEQTERFRLIITLAQDNSKCIKQD